MNIKKITYLILILISFNSYAGYITFIKNDNFRLSSDIDDTGSSQDIEYQLKGNYGSVNITSDLLIRYVNLEIGVNIIGVASGGDILVGDPVEVAINNKKYVTSVGSNGSFLLNVNALDLILDNNIKVVVKSNNNKTISLSNLTYTTTTNELNTNIDITSIGENNDILSTNTNMVSVKGYVQTNSADYGYVNLKFPNSTNIYKGDLLIVEYGPYQYDKRGTFDILIPAEDFRTYKELTSSGTLIGYPFVFNYLNESNENEESSTTETYFLTYPKSRATIRVNTITSDDTISAAESESIVKVTGNVGFDASAGDKVTFTVNNNNYEAIVTGSKTWSVDVLGSDLAADTSFVATVTIIIEGGANITATTTSTHTVNLSI